MSVSHIIQWLWEHYDVQLNYHQKCWRENSDHHKVCSQIVSQGGFMVNYLQQSHPKSEQIYTVVVEEVGSYVTPLQFLSSQQLVFRRQNESSR